MARRHGSLRVVERGGGERAASRSSRGPTRVLALEYRYARLAQPGAAWRSAYLTTIGTAPGNDRAVLGQEIDAMVRWSPWEPLSLEAGYSVFFVGAGARAILVADGIGKAKPDGMLSTEALSQFAYLQATLRIP